MANHQCAHFSVDPCLPYEQAINRIVCYLKSTADKGIILRPDETSGLECHVNRQRHRRMDPAYIRAQDNPVVTLVVQYLLYVRRELLYHNLGIYHPSTQDTSWT
jgi:hypothetical protein